VSPECEVVWNGVNDGCGGDLLAAERTVAHPPANLKPASVRDLSVAELCAIERAVVVRGATTEVARRFNLRARSSLLSVRQRLARLRSGL